MDLPTYTNIWRIEKRLYKLYDLRLPMPLPLVQIGVFVGVFVPWIVMLQLVGVPFHAPWHVVYLVPPGVLTWLATRPVIEGKRLTELLISQVRYLTEARTWARLTPIREPAEVVIVGRVWRRGRMSGRRVHAARPAPQAAGRAAPQRVPAAPAAETAAPAERPAAAPRRPGTPQVRAAAAHRPPAPGLRATPRDGTPTPPAAAAHRREPARPDQARPDQAGPERTRPERIRPERTRPERTRPETVRSEAPRRARPVPGTPPQAPGLPPTPGPAISVPPASPAAPAAGPAAPADRPGWVAPAASAPSAARAAVGGSPSAPGDAPAGERPETGGRYPGGTRRPARPRNTAHEADGPIPPPRQAPPPALPPAGRPPAGPGDVDRPARPEGPAAARRGPEAARSAEPAGRHAAPPAPGPARPGAPAAPVRGDEGGPARPAAASAAGPASPSAATPRPPSPGSPSPGSPAPRSASPTSSPAPPAAGRAGAAERSGPTPPLAAGGRPDGPAGVEREGASPPHGRADEAAGAPPAGARPFGQGRHAGPPADTPGDASHAAGERPVPARPQQDPAAAADAATASEEERRAAQARTGQIAWPGAGRRRPVTPPGDGTGSSSGRPQDPRRGRAHGEETPTRESSRPSARAREGDVQAAAWTPPAPPRRAGGGPAVPPRAPGAPRRQTPPGRGTPAQGGTSQPATPQGVRPPAPARPAAPPRTGGSPPARRPADTEPAEPPASPARAVRSGPASPVRPGPMPQLAHDDDGGADARGRRRIFSGGGHGDGDYEERVRTAFAGARRVVVLGCTGGAGQTVTALMLGHTFAQQRGDRIVAVDVNPGPGAMARRARTETRETLTSLITHAEQVTGYQVMRRYTSISKSGLEVIAAGKNPVQALDDRDYALAMRTLDRFYSITLLDAAAAVVARVLPYADQIVLVAPASSDAPRAVAMTFEWLDGHGYEDLRARAVTVINGVSRRSMDDVEQAESVARGRCRALVRIPWDDHLSLDRAPRNELRSLRSPTRKAYIALGGVVAGGFVQVPQRYPQQEVTR